MTWPQAFRDVGVALACALGVWAFFKYVTR